MDVVIVRGHNFPERKGYEEYALMHGIPITEPSGPTLFKQSTKTKACVVEAVVEKKHRRYNWTLLSTFELLSLETSTRGDYVLDFPEVNKE